VGSSGRMSAARIAVLDVDGTLGDLPAALDETDLA
jgi:hypothetical protein